MATQKHHLQLPPLGAKVRVQVTPCPLLVNMSGVWGAMPYKCGTVYPLVQPDTHIYIKPMETLQQRSVATACGPCLGAVRLLRPTLWCGNICLLQSWSKLWEGASVEWTLYIDQNVGNIVERSYFIEFAVLFPSLFVRVLV